MMEVVLSLMLISSAHFLLTEENQNDSIPSSSGGNESYCDFPGICGPNGNCDVNKSLACGCLDGFTPKSPAAFDGLDYTPGCVRKKPFNCSTDVFVAYAVFQEPTGTYYYHSFFNQSLGKAEGCKEKCKSNCSCMAAYTEIESGECKLWSGDLFDVKVKQEGRQYLYIRMPALDQAEPGGRSHRRSDHKVVGVVVGSAAVVILGMILASWYMLTKRTESQELGEVRISEMLSHTNEQEGDLELPLLDLSRIAMATDNFSLNNKLGEGGFGPVYKGVLDDGQQIAVKRLSSSSGQGLNEFKTEAWDLWKQGRSLELVDEWLKETWNVSEVQRCIHISLLCAQQHPQDRPTMSSVLLMLGTEIDLPQPKYPTFFVAESSEGTSSSSCKNELSVTELEPR